MRNLIILIVCIIGFVSCKSPEARRPVQRTSGTFIKESIERNKKIIEEEEALIRQVMDGNPEIDYIASENGFWYYYNIKNTSEDRVPVHGDEVTFIYDIRTLDGKVILTAEDNKVQSYIIDQSNQDLISGLREGLKLMKEGEQITFLFPSYKAYGYYGIVDKLGINIPVQSTVTLKSIEQ